MNAVQRLEALTARDRIQVTTADPTDDEPGRAGRRWLVTLIRVQDGPQGAVMRTTTARQHTRPTVTAAGPPRAAEVLVNFLSLAAQYSMGYGQWCASTGRNPNDKEAEEMYGQLGNMQTELRELLGAQYDEYVRALAAQTRTTSKSSRDKTAVAVVVLVAVVIIGIVISNNRKHSNSGSSSTYTPPSYSYTPPTYTPQTQANVPAPPRQTGGANQPVPPPVRTTPTENPYTKGTCLSGTLPNSTTTVTVTGVSEVSCSSSDAHYKVIQNFPFTSDMSKCDNVPNTQYVFSHKYTMNGSVINQYVYCVVGLGSYAR